MEWVSGRKDRSYRRDNGMLEVRGNPVNPSIEPDSHGVVIHVVAVFVAQKKVSGPFFAAKKGPDTFFCATEPRIGTVQDSHHDG
jgi:hypothetical protein